MMNFGNCFGHVHAKNKLETESYKMPSSNVFNAVEPGTTSFYYKTIQAPNVNYQIFPAKKYNFVLIFGVTGLFCTSLSYFEITCLLCDEQLLGDCC